MSLLNCLEPTLEPRATDHVEVRNLPHTCSDPAQPLCLGMALALDCLCFLLSYNICEHPSISMQPIVVQMKYDSCLF